MTLMRGPVAQPCCAALFRSPVAQQRRGVTAFALSTSQRSPPAQPCIGR
jgi:hypothetical protein